MKFLTISIVTAGLGLMPLATAWAASGSDVPPATAKAAVAGANPNTGALTTKPQVGTAGGGMTAGSGRKMGGMDKKNTTQTAGAAQ